MDSVFTDDRRQEFQLLLKELSSKRTLSSDEVAEYLVRLDALYYIPEEEKHLRHLYSDIFPIIVELKGDMLSEEYGTLSINIQKLISDYIPQKDHPDLRLNLWKLYDHVSLEMGRMVQNEGIQRVTEMHDHSLRQLEEKIAQSDKRVKLLRAEIDSSVEKLEQALSDAETRMGDWRKEADEKLEGMQREYIAILGIFSAVVLTFLGGIAFSTSVLENLHQISTYRLILTVSMIGIVLLNAIYLLFGFVQTLVGRPGPGRPAKVILVVNAILISFILLDFVMWQNGVIEERNHQIDRTYAQSILPDAQP